MFLFVFFWLNPLVTKKTICQHMCAMSPDVTRPASPQRVIARLALLMGRSCGSAHSAVAQAVQQTCLVSVSSMANREMSPQSPWLTLWAQTFGYIPCAEHAMKTRYEHVVVFGFWILKAVIRSRKWTGAVTMIEATKCHAEIGTTKHSWMQWNAFFCRGKHGQTVIANRKIESWLGQCQPAICVRICRPLFGKRS